MRKNVIRFLLPSVVGVVIVMAYLLVVGSALHKPAPSKVPLAVVAPPAIGQHLVQAFSESKSDAVAITPYASTEVARADLMRQKIDGIFELGPTGLHVVTASASGEVTAAAVTQIGQTLGQKQHMPVTVEDITPAAQGLGNTLVVMFLLLLTTVAGIVTQALIRQQKLHKKLVVWVAASVVSAICIGYAGAASAAIIGEYRSVFWQVGGILTLCALMSAAVSAGITEVIGDIGLSVSAVLLVPFGVATAGALFDPHFLPSFYAHIAPYMSSAATVTLIRQAAYFGNVATAHPCTVLMVWLLGGVAIALVARLVRDRMSKTASTSKKD